MTDGETRTAETPGFPAPGSAVPGAPPVLKRALTPADGVPVGPKPHPDARDGVQLAVSPGSPGASAPGRTGSPLIAAAAMLGIAAGLELAALMTGRSRRRSTHSG
ncbi:hypothetical protein [Mycobacterium sp. URHB0021]|jgi:hypothetical protein